MIIQADREDRIKAAAEAIASVHGTGVPQTPLSLAELAVAAVDAADKAEADRRQQARLDRAEQMRRDIAEGRALSK